MLKKIISLLPNSYHWPNYNQLKNILKRRKVNIPNYTNMRQPQQTYVLKICIQIIYFIID